MGQSGYACMGIRIRVGGGKQRLILYEDGSINTEWNDSCMQVELNFLYFSFFFKVFHK